MTRKECLEQAMGCVLRDRQKQYGEPEDCFETIAMMWSAYLGKIIQGWDVATMMALLKIARIKANPAHADNWCDLAGYAACGAECRQKFETEMKKTVEDAFETFPHLKPEAEGGCCQNGNDQPEFKSGDAVEWYSFGARGMEPGWHPAAYLRRAEDPDYCVVREPDGRERIVDRHYLRRPEAKAEGCEYTKGDKVQCRVTLPSVSDRLWVDGEYVRYEKGRSRPHVVFTNATLELVSDEDIRPAPKAEGCEALVEKDAPQTAQELYQHIVDVNPSVFNKKQD